MRWMLTVALCLALLCLTGLGAATLERLSLEEMTQQSTEIVRGRVAASSVIPQGSILYTTSKIEVLERWKGPETGLVEAVVPGGSLGGVRQTFSGAPSLKEGAEYVLFLWKSPSGLNHVIGLSQGVFDIRRDEKGGKVAFRAASAELMLDSETHRPVRDESVRVRLGDLGERIAQELNGGARK
ncbi:MAG: hypothetical protein WD696_13245 [Bryobacteraceae bacterium]